MAFEITSLPEDCISKVISLTSPKDACRISLVAPIFRSAAQSDAVWERFLPSDYRELISGSIDGADSLLTRFQSKNELYMYLCHHHILIDSGRKSFSLEKSSGKKCYRMSARDLYITSSDIPQYWRWTSLPQSRFSEVAELLKICVLEFGGKISTKMLSSGTNYAAYLMYTRSETMSGFKVHPGEASVRMDGHEAKRRAVCLDPSGFSWPRYSANFYIEYAKNRHDGWVEIKLGEFFVMGDEEGDVEFNVVGAKGVEGWKHGIIIEAIEIRPIGWY